MDLILYFIKSSIFEKIAFCSSLLYVIFAAKQNRFCWIFSIISTSIYIHLTFKVNLYFETILNIFYLLIAIKGLWDWNNKKYIESSNIHYQSTKFHFVVIFFGFLLVLIFGLVAKSFTNQSLSFLDAFTTVFSFITTYMVIKRIIENWIYWIVIDAASVYLFYSKDLKLTAFLFFIFTILAIYGFFSWRKIMLNSKN